jgi:hypothetical protein
MRSSTRYPDITPARHRHRTLPTLAAERHDPYEIDTTADAEVAGGVEADAPTAEAAPTGSADRADVATTTARPVASTQDRPPFGLPVLAELPALAGALTRLADADAAMLDALCGVADLLDDDEVAHTTGIGLDHWIGIVARHTRMDRRFLLRAAHQLVRFPTLRAAAQTRAVSWPQLRGLSLALREVPPVLTDRTDSYLGLLIDQLDADADPDAIIEQLRRTLAAWQAELTPEPIEVPSGNRLTLQANLEGTGGQGYLDLDAIGLALVDEATHPRAGQLDHPGGLAAARADNLLSWLTHTCHPDPADRTGSDAADGPDGPDGPDAPDGPDGGPGRRHVDTTGDGGADATGGTGHTDGDVAGGTGEWMESLAPPKLLLRAELSDLLDTDQLPTELLTRLVGGSVRLTADAARRLCDRHGVELRTIIVDQGHVVGVGRQTRRPPGWFSDIVAALHDTCTGPLCDRPARGAQLDHAVPWWPTGPGRPPGTTDVDNIGPLCRTTNQDKEAAGWHATQTGDGRRRWHHPRSGLTTTSIPATWRPTAAPERPPDRDRPPGTAPPGRAPG